jgi:hypothetical protein
MLIGTMNVGSIFHKGTIVCLLSDAYAISVTNIRNGKNLQKKPADVDLYEFTFHACE